jgi:hypothetical protein
MERQGLIKEDMGLPKPVRLSFTAARNIYSGQAPDTNRSSTLIDADGQPESNPDHFRRRGRKDREQGICS